MFLQGVYNSRVSMRQRHRIFLRAGIVEVTGSYRDKSLTQRIETFLPADGAPGRAADEDPEDPGTSIAVDDREISPGRRGGGSEGDGDVRAELDGVVPRESQTANKTRGQPGGQPLVFLVGRTGIEPATR